MFLTRHTLISQVASDRFLLYQVLTRKGILLNDVTLTALQQWMKQGLIGAPAHPPVFLDVSTFSLADCLMDNPSGIKPGDLASLVLQESTWDSFKQLLQEYALIAADGTYTAQLGKRNNPLDYAHTGNFHQQIGDFLLRNSRETSPEQWWIYQKFNDDLKTVRPTLYKSVQYKFLDQYFTDLKGQEWLDFGCGVGFYSRFFADKGASVYGVDPSELYIQLARDNFAIPGRVEFDARSFKKLADLDVLANRRFDSIFMSDVFLYYFEAYDRSLELKPAQLLKALAKLLKPGGRLFIMDPHGCFHLQGWWADTQPYLISAEYRHRKYRVTPTLEEISLAAEEAGLVIRRVRECYSQGDLPQRAQATAVAREFPLLWFFEMVNLPGA